MPKIITDDLSLGEVYHEWTIPEYERHERGQRWYIIMITLGLAGVIYGMVEENFLFSLIILLAAIIMFLQSHQEPIQVYFQITELGVAVGSRFYPYSELDEFYIIYNPPAVKTLFIKMNSALRPMIRVPLLDVDPNEVRFSLRQNLPEDTEKEEEPLSDTFARQWKIH